MAKTFYHYEKRADLGSYVDWAAIGKTVSDGLIKVSADRQAKRDELDKITNESITTINELAVGQPQTSSEFYMDGANNIKEALGLSYREMKAGRLNPNEYLKQRQNIMDDLGQMQAAANSFKTDWEAMSKRLENSASPTGASEQEIYQNELLDSFGITKDKAIYVNPVDNRIYIATRDANGKIIKDPSKLLPISHLTSLRKDQVNKYDVVGEVNKRVKTLGDVTRSVMSGRVMTLNDAVQRPEYMKAENDMISSMMTSPRATGTILTNYVGGYGVTESKEVADKDPNKILLVKDSNGLLHPKLTREQEDVAREALRAQIRVQLKSIETPTPVQQPSGASVDKNKLQQTNAQHLELIRKIYSGNSTEGGGAADAIRALNPNIASIDKKDGKLRVAFTDGNIENFDIAGGFEGFVTQAGRFLIPGLDTEQAFIGWANSPYNTRSQSYRPDTVSSRGARDAKGQAATALADANISSPIFSLKQEAGINSIQKMLKNLGEGFEGLTAKKTGSGAFDHITITGGKASANHDPSIKLEFDNGTPEASQAQLALLLSWIEEEIQARASEQNSTTSTPSPVSGGNAKGELD